MSSRIVQACGRQAGDKDPGCQIQADRARMAELARCWLWCAVRASPPWEVDRTVASTVSQMIVSVRRWSPGSAGHPVGGGALGMVPLRADAARGSRSRVSYAVDRAPRPPVLDKSVFSTRPEVGRSSGAKSR